MAPTIKCDFDLQVPVYSLVPLWYGQLFQNTPEKHQHSFLYDISYVSRNYDL